MKKNPIERSLYINDTYKEYLRSTFKFGNNDLQQLFEDELEKEELFKGPYVSLEMPFARGKSLRELMQEGVLCNSFTKLEKTDFGRPLYAHQEQAVRWIGEGHSAIVTTGTGSGKTECFLYPILNELLRDVEKGNCDIGIRALFLYPMNALVNDQIDRVREILSNCPEITFGFFTGDTPENVSSNYKEKLGEENGVVIPNNELVSREEIRKNPPHLLFTNYTMLEYLMIRPNDFALFAPGRLKNWKFVVLDEAHTYYGSLGIEISMLLRRVTAYAETKPRFILTSATLGEQGKSEKEIVDFATKLTSVEFQENDIIFSDRIPLTETIEYTVSGSDYTLLKNNLHNDTIVRQVYGKYIGTSARTIQSLLYELLCHDAHVHQLYDHLRNEAQSFRMIGSILDDLEDKELIALIDLINIANNDGIELFNMKYHSFVRPLSGAYITLTDSPQLSLTKTNEIGGYKAFELGNCKLCNAPYIIGRIQHNSTNQLDYLFQNKEVDIYENYGNNEYVRLDYFLLNNRVDEEVDLSLLEEFVLCTKCGCIYPAANLKAEKCECDPNYKRQVFRVNDAKREKKSDDAEGYNNIRQCACCGQKSKAGIVKSLNLGKDEGTALIAQTLYEAIDEEAEKVKKTGRLSLKLVNEKKVEEDQKVKQFLSFSDSRQQASFAAVFMNSTHVRMLRKRLIWDVIERESYRPLKVDELAAYLTETIKKKDIFPNDMSAHKNAWITLLVDLLKVDGNYDGEGMGLYYFDLDLSDIMDQIDEEDVKEEFGKYNIDKSDLETIMKVVFGVFKTTPAINYVKSTLTPDEKKEYLEFRRFDNYVMFEGPKTEKGIKSFLPVGRKDNMVVQYVQKVCQCSTDEVKTILDIVFNNLAVAGEILKKHETKNAYQIDASRYIVKNYKNSKFYKCCKCGRLTPYNVHNACVQDKCEGTLSEVNPDEELKYNYYRKQYKEKKIERIVIKEHTAQLDRKTAKQYQQDFKKKKINILSCSTTFEMGVDIGALETVYMRNIPPTPANYVQRAGRAGRRKDSSAYILTYCGTGSHDYTYFTAPERMISGVIRPPYFNVLNKKIIVRHLMASSLGFFFRQNPEYCKSIGKLVFEDGLKEFRTYMMSHPNDLNRYISDQVIPESMYSDYHDFRWYDEMEDGDEKLKHFVEIILKIEKEFEEAKKQALKEENYKDADYFSRQIDRLGKERVIDSLSKYCIIPKYGFPVDVVELQIYERGIPNAKYDLNRDLKLALSEYAPDSEIIVDGKKYTSKYISLPRNSQFPKHHFCTCSNCRKINVFLAKRQRKKCKYCGNPIETEKTEYYIEPVNGFKTGVTKESTRMKPKRSYAGEVSYLDGGLQDREQLVIGRSILIETSSDNELLVLNRSPFYMCPVCGYSKKAKGGNYLPHDTEAHKNYRQYDCDNKELERLRLGHSFRTDVARFTIPLLQSIDGESYAKALSFMYAFLEGISTALGIERTDIDGILEMNLDERCYDVLIYDNVAGGAGHVKRLMETEAVISSLQEALAHVSKSCCDENTSCYNCLRNYYNQTYHSRLRRGYAKEVLEELLS